MTSGDLELLMHETTAILPLMPPFFENKPLPNHNFYEQILNDDEPLQSRCCTVYMDNEEWGLRLHRAYFEPLEIAETPSIGEYIALQGNVNTRAISETVLGLNLPHLADIDWIPDDSEALSPRYMVFGHLAISRAVLIREDADVSSEKIETPVADLPYAAMAAQKLYPDLDPLDAEALALSLNEVEITYRPHQLVERDELDVILGALRRGKSYECYCAIADAQD